MTILEIPADSNLPVRVGGIPIVRFIMTILIATTAHLVISGLLWGGWFNFGMAAAGPNGGQGRLASGAFLLGYNVWNAGYVYVWMPNKEKVLPALLPYQKPPAADPAESAYDPYRRYRDEDIRIHQRRTVIETTLFVSWATLCGFGLALFDARRRTRRSGGSRLVHL